MATHVLEIKRKDKVCRVEVTDLLDDSGFWGYHYNYRFLLKRQKNKAWVGIVYRPGEKTSFNNIKDSPTTNLAAECLNLIERNYRSNSKPKIK